MLKEHMTILRVDYFYLVAIGKDDADAYYNMITLLTEANDYIDVDFSSAYKYANMVTLKGHTFGTYMFAMLNEYQLGSVVKTCEISIEFFKQVSERNLTAKKKFDLAYKLYKDGYYKIAALIYLELAEEGFEVIYPNSDRTS
jgi:hypothetical protein